MISEDLKRLEKQAITNKFRPPQMRKVLDRPRLLRVADSLSDERLLLISAGPGYGKTTFMAQIAQNHQGPAVWYQIDELDQDLSFFLKHLIVGISQACNGVGTIAASKYVEARDVSLEGKYIITTLMEEFKDLLGAPLLLCFDDFHLIAKSEYLRWMIPFLIEELPSNCSICFSTRTSKDLPIGKIRARGLMKEVEARDLQFSFDELQDLTTTMWDVLYNEEILKRLLKTTEGWAAGLVLAEEHLRSGENVPEIISGSRLKKNVYQYLAEEALGRHPKEMRILLEKCSLLDPIDPTICENAFKSIEINSSLAHAEIMNLFTTRLDNTNLYRFHPMFREFLQDKLCERIGDLGTRRLRGRLGKAYEESNDKKNAIEQYIHSDNVRKAVDMLGEIGTEMLKEGQYVALRQLLAMVPRELYKKEFSIYEGQLFLATGNPNRALRVLRSLKNSLEPSEKDSLFEISVSIAECLLMLCKPGDAVKEIEPLVKFDYEPRLKMDLLHRLSFYYWHNYDEKGVKICVKDARKIVDDDPTVDKIGKVEVMMAYGHLRRGEFSTAREILTDAIGIDGFSASFENLFLNNLASCLTMIGRYEDARIYAEQCQMRITSQKEEVWLHVLYDTYGCIQCSLGNWESGLTYFRESIQKVNSLGLRKTEACAAMCHLGSFSRRCGDYTQAYDYHRSCLNAAEHSGSYYDIVTALTNIGADYVRMANLVEPKSYFERAHEIAKDHEFKYALTQIEYQMAWMNYEMGDFKASLANLSSALDRAAYYQHNHYIIQEGMVTLPLITLALRNNVQTHYLFEILEVIGEPALEVIDTLIDGSEKQIKIKCAKLISKISSSSGMALARRLSKDDDEEIREIASEAQANIRDSFEKPDQLLTRRESEIISLIAAGETNDVIAKRLFISERTVKAHVSHIFKKTGFKNRLEAALYYQNAMKNSTP